jgi:hypothetical protein
MSAWTHAFLDNWITSLASALTTYTVVKGPLQNIEADAHDVKVVTCSIERSWNAGESPTTDRTYDIKVFFGVLIRGMDDGDCVDTLWDAIDAVEDAVWVLLAAGTFRSSNCIDEVVGVVCRLGASRSGEIEATLRVRRD